MLLQVLLVVVVSYVLVDLGLLVCLLQCLGGLLQSEEGVLGGGPTVILDDLVHLGVLDHHEHVEVEHPRELYDLLEQRLLPLAFEVDPLAPILDKQFLRLLLVDHFVSSLARH